MSSMIRIGIMGYGNLGRGVETSVNQMPDMDLVAVFTRRSPESLVIQTKSAKVLHIDEAKNLTGDIDVMILCGGSATDLPTQGPRFAAMFNTVDSYDTHAKIPEYFASVDAAARAHGKTSAISVGWDPGLFSIVRLLSEAVLPHGRDYTFWGRGVSQGHSDAIRRIKGVKDAVQYTVPIPAAVERVRSGENPDLKTRERHIRECYVVVEEGADQQKIAEQIRSMPNYFADYDTLITFVSEEQLKREHSGMPHGGFVIRSGRTGKQYEHKQLVEFSLTLDSNPEFTASVMVPYARAVYRMNQLGQTGAKSVFDVPLAMLSPRTAEELREKLL